MKIIAGNWKMNGSHAMLDEMITACGKIDTKNQVILCVPFTMLHPIDGKISLGAQDVSAHDHGAYTGEVSASMLRDAGAKYVIVGHSERRAYHNESNADVAAKAASALSVGLTPIICVGETMDEKNAGRTMEIIESGVRESVPNVSGDIIVAYEPIWAIGTGKTATAEVADETCGFIRETVKRLYDEETSEAIRIQYGGSVKTSNIDELMAKPNIDGALIGGASLKAEDFIVLVKAAVK